MQGSRFAILHGDGPRPSFSIYAMKSDLKTTVKGVNLVGTQPNKQANQIHWSPQGKYLVLGGLKVRLCYSVILSSSLMQAQSILVHIGKICTDIQIHKCGQRGVCVSLMRD